MGLLFLIVAIVGVALILQFNKKERKVESYPNATFCFNQMNNEKK